MNVMGLDPALQSAAGTYVKSGSELSVSDSASFRGDVLSKVL